MNKFKKVISTFLIIALIISMSSISVTASDFQDPKEFQLINAIETIGEVSSVDSRLTSSSIFSIDNEDPNKIEDIEYVLIYDTVTGEEYTRILEPDEDINNIFFEKSSASNAGGVLYTVSLYPNEGSSEISIIYSITGFIGSKPNRIDLDFTLFRGLERGTTGTSLAGCEATIQGILNVKIGKTVTCKVQITQTGFYFAKIDSNIRNLLGVSMGTDSAQTSQILTNKRAIIYPYYVDQWSGKVMTEPATVTWARTPSIDWDSSKDRSNYIRLYSQLYPNNGWDWNGANTHIHHIRPRNLGGNNDFNNLIPIPAYLHTGTVSPWFVNY